MNSRSSQNIDYLKDLKLNRPWPSPQVKELFYNLHHRYCKIALDNNVLRGQNVKYEPKNLKSSFRKLCREIEKDCETIFRGFGGIHKPKSEELWPRALFDDYGNEFYQVISSVLGMLLHINPLVDPKYEITNKRRPGKAWSTYPNSPGLSKLMADSIFKRLCKPSLLHSQVNRTMAAKIVNKHLNLKIIDASMESGQLLLEIALSWKRLITSTYEIDSKSARNLLEIGWRKLCTGVIWGIDRNPLAVIAVRLVFRLLFKLHGFNPLEPKHLITANTLFEIEENQLGEFDAVINNPPWGEKLQDWERRKIRELYHCANPICDTYLAFIEKSLSFLKSEGIFSYCIPAQTIGSNKAYRLRQYIASNAYIEELILLPREVFSDACIRGLVISGNLYEGGNRGECRVINYPSRNSNKETCCIRQSVIKRNRFSSKKNNTWLSHFTRSKRLNASSKDLITLGSVASVAMGHSMKLDSLNKSCIEHNGRNCRRLFCGLPPFGIIPALKGSNIYKFGIKNVSYYIDLNVNGVDTESVNEVDAKRIFLREFISSDGQLSATTIDFKALALRGIITITPNKVEPHLLTAILNSSRMRNIVNNTVVGTVKSKFRTILLHEVINLPIPSIVMDLEIGGVSKSRISKRKSNICNKIFEISRNLCHSQPRTKGYIENSAKLDTLVNDLY